MTLAQFIASVCQPQGDLVPMSLGAIHALGARDAGLRILSLDFDGVLHPALSTDATTDMHPFGWLQALVDLLEPHPDVSVLVHSTWRYAYRPAELREMLGELGPRFVGAAPRGPRYESVLWWLQQNPGFTSFRILDDDPTEFPTPAPAELILCDSRRGVSDARVQAALIEWLGA